jgi:hypothetical protein
MRRTKVILTAVSLTALAACGGGTTGGVDTTEAPVSTAVPTDTTGAVLPTDTTRPAPPGSLPDTSAPSEDELPPAGWPEAPFMVEGAALVVMESFPIQVRLDVSGSMPTPCHEPYWRIADDGETIAVELFTAADPDLACIQVIEEAEVSIPLGSWPEGSRTVELNGEMVGEFAA